ncbi:DNA-binding response regulator [Flexivirga endophytica]|uniref:DNA-binding response regulator n=1 Tax=Flexivirga endophytica TaxID=1849103 RepID=A0A916T7I1_9MICO|nr:response regulator transcription factor [Flexivirga endophytica]GGB34614.1 DNA-binding response regulator [Flexivirga endophytica]GHB42535.1 DNA-binding response regulator [Flexivirga endophytica]
MAIRIYLLDDHEVVRRGVRELLDAEPDFEVVGDAGTAAEARRDIVILQPDVAVLDARLPDGSGIDVCRDARSAVPALRALIFTSYDDEHALEAAVLAGAAGYLLKDIRGPSLTDAVRAVATGRNLLREGDADRLRERWMAAAPTDHRLQLLTPQERRILDHIARGMTNREISEHLHLAEKTVKNYVTSVLSKLGLERRTQAAIFAITHSERGQGRDA